MADVYQLTDVDGSTVYEFEIGDAVRVDYDLSGAQTGTDSIEGVVEGIEGTPADDEVTVKLSTGWIFHPPDGPVVLNGRRRGRVEDVTVLFE